MYKLFYNLNDSPFKLKPDLKYFYTTRPHKQAISHLRHGFNQQNGAIVLTGEKGTGKTVLIAHMLSQLDKNNSSIAFFKQPPKKNNDFLPAILRAFQIPTTESQPKILFNTLHKFMLEQAKLNKKVLLVVDNAESLSHYCLELIRLLSTLHHNDNNLIRIVLVGTNELNVVLSNDENKSFKQQIAASFDLLPLQTSDTQDYIEHRLKIAGWNEDPAIDKDAFETIHQLAGGIPYEINRYCDRLLMLGMLSENHHLSKDDVANLTPTIMAKLEKIESLRLEKDKQHGKTHKPISQASSTHTEPKEEKQIQQKDNKLNMEDINLDRSRKESKPFPGKETIMTIAATFLVSFLSVVIFNNMTETKSTHSPNIASSDTHSKPANNHSNTTVAQNSHEPATHVPTDTNAHQQADDSLSPMEFLTIGLLSNKQDKSRAESHNSQLAQHSSNEEQYTSRQASHEQPQVSPGTVASVIKGLSANIESAISAQTHTRSTSATNEGHQHDTTLSDTSLKSPTDNAFAALFD